MRIFVCEFVTGGGLYREALPQALAREGGLMLHALLDDLSEMPEISVLTTRDVRLPALQASVEQIWISSDDDVWACWEDCIRQVDAVWLIAPESGGTLERLSRLVLSHGRQLIGCSPDVVAVTSSKYHTVAALNIQGITCVPSYRFSELPDGPDGKWVVKPDDGVGCENNRCFVDRDAMVSYLESCDYPVAWIAQPILPGVAASLSVLCHQGRACLLSCNRQLVEIRDNSFSYHGSVLNDQAGHWASCENLVQRIAAAMPGLCGYIGVDVLIDGERITVLEINPRLTTSYAGLKRATGCNPARLTLDLIYNDRFDLPPMLARNVVKISLDE